MKKILLATTVLVGTAGFAAAEVSLSGNGHMGIAKVGDADATFLSRARVSFGLSGETDGGLSFGGSFRADNAVGAAAGTGGSVFISGAFGKLTMGDVDGAAQMATGNVAGVGFFGINDTNWNESTFISAGGSALFDTTDPTALYEYAAGAVTVYASVTNPSGDGEAYAVGAKYATDTFTVGAGYESADDNAGLSVDHIVVKGSATFSGVTVQALYGQADLGATDADQYAVSASYAMDAIGVTAYYTDDSELPGGAEAYGVGASYDLGGGAAVAGGVAKNKTTDETGYDLGVTFSF